MKKLNLQKLNLRTNNLLNRNELKTVFGGDGGYGGGGGSNCREHGAYCFVGGIPCCVGLCILDSQMQVTGHCYI